MRAHRRQDDPVALIALDAWDHPGAEQGGFARARSAKQGNDFRAALGASCIEALNEAADVIIAAEVERRVLLLEGVQAGIWRTAGIPGKAALRIERDPGELFR